MSPILLRVFAFMALTACSLGQDTVVYGDMLHALNEPPRHNIWNEKHVDGLGDILSTLQFSNRMRRGNYYSDKLLGPHLTDGERVEANVSAACWNATQRFLLDLVKREMYALRALDAMGKLPSGVLSGNLNWLGSYGECLNATKYDGQTKVFKGQYCTAYFKAPTLPVPASYTPTLGVCVADACSNSDVFNLFESGLMKIPSLPVKMVSASCATPKNWSEADIACLIVCGVIGLFLLCGTIYDIIVHWKASDVSVAVLGSGEVNPDDVTASLTGGGGTEDGAGPGMEGRPLVPVTVQQPTRGLLGRILLCFSVKTNARKLLSAQQHEGTLTALNGIRVLSMFWVILGHTHLFVIYITDNLVVMESVIERFTFQTVMNGTVSVDSFFFLSGLLVAYLTLRQMNGGQWQLRNWAIFYFHRIWRLTPLYAMVIFFYSTVFLHLPDGPNMRSMDTSAPEPCRKYWWTNLLYINNFVPPHITDECIYWSWYLANDMQFFAISPIFIILLFRKRNIGLAVLFGITLVPIVTTGVLATTNHIGLSPLGPIGTGQPDKGPLTDDSVYIKPWTRIGAYLVGMATGYVLATTNGNIRMKKWMVVLGWSVATAVGVAIVYGLYGDINGHYYSQAVDSLYISTHRVAWSLCLAWVAIACASGYGGPVNLLLSWKAWIPLGRLTYGAYLLHPIVMNYNILSAKQLVHYTDINMVYTYVGNLVISYVLAAVASVCLEAPMLGLEKIVLKPSSQT